MPTKLKKIECEDYCSCADYDSIDAKQHEDCVDGRCAYDTCYHQAVNGDYCPCHSESNRG